MPPFLTANLRWLAAGFLLLFCGCFGQTFVVALSGGAIRREFGLSDGAFGALYAGVTLAAALALAGLGGLIDRWPAPRVVSLAAGLLAAGAALLALAPNLPVLAAALFLLRLAGQGLMLQTAYTLLGRWFSAERGRAVSLAATGLNAGQACLPLALVAAGAVVGWRGAWFAIAGFLVLVALPLARHLVRRERVPAATGGAGPSEGATRAQALADPYLYGLLAAMLPPSFISNTIFFHQAHLAESRGWSPEVLAAAFPPYAVATVLCLLLAGRLVDRFSALALLPVSTWCRSASPAWSSAGSPRRGPPSPSCCSTASPTGSRSPVRRALAGGLRHPPSRSDPRRHRGDHGAGHGFGPFLAGGLIDAGVPFSGLVTGMGLYCLVVSAASASFGPARAHWRAPFSRRP